MVSSPVFVQLIFPLANCPEPSLFNFHLVPFVILPSEPSVTFDFVIDASFIAQPPIFPLVAVTAPEKDPVAATRLPLK